MVRPLPQSVSPRGFRRTALAALLTNMVIVVTGGVVRLTDSGLGCPDWPTCEGMRLVPAATGAWHQFIEFGNRLLTFAVLAAALAVVLAARRTAGVDARTRRLAWVLPVGVVGQAVLGGITVLTGLHPLIVAAHFLLSAVLIAVAVVVHHRARQLDDRARPPTPAARPLRATIGTLVAVAGAVLILGTIVTAAGPHAGDPETGRLGVDIRSVARLHAGAVWAVTFLTVWVAARAPSGSTLRAGAVSLFVVELVQGGVGYTQYALGIPAALVSLHLLLATVFWALAVRLPLLASGTDHAPRAPDPHTGAVGVDRSASVLGARDGG